MSNIEKILYDENIAIEVKVYRIARILHDHNHINDKLWYAILEFKDKHMYEFSWYDNMKNEEEV